MAQPVLTRGLLLRARDSVRVQTVALIVLMIMFLGCGMVAVQLVNSSTEEMIARTMEARLRGNAAQDLMAALQDCETGQRGYLLTGRPSYLTPYDATINRVEGLVQALEPLMDGDPALLDTYQRLAANARDKVAELRQTVSLAQRDGPGAAGTVVLTDAGERYMQEARAAAAEIIHAAERDRARFARQLQRRQQLVLDILLGSLVAAVMLLGAAALVLVWSKDRLRRARDGERREAGRLQAAIEHVPDGVAVFDAGGRLRLSNARFAPTLAIPQDLVHPGLGLGPIAAAAAFDPVLLPTRPAVPSSSEVRQGPRTLEVWRSPMPDGGQMLSVADVTRRVQAEDVGRQAQKMDVLGQMTGGIAHDFNNLLQIVSANLELVRGKAVRSLPDDAALLARIDAATAGVARGARLTRHLLAFARRQPLAPEPLDPTRLLMGLEDVLRRTLGEAIRLDLVVDEGLWSMRADPTQFENALLNLALNARDAMVGPDGLPTGHLTVEAANAALDEEYAARSMDVAPGQYVMFAVSDTGTGMTPDQIARAAEPFYTTKAEGRGTGLGLSMVLGFAKQSGGHFQLYSEPGRGTTARLYIPRTQAAVQTVAEAARPDLPRGAGELVLLVEDDQAVRRAAHDAVRGLGYDVAEASDADAALALLEDGLRPQVLFTDVVMPGMLSAPALAERAKALVPGLAVLFTSGYTQNSIVHNGQLDAGVTLLSKPWRTDQLARALHAVLTGVLRPALRRRILLVEDEELVRMTTADALVELGFDVLQAGTGAGALSRLDPPPDLLLTDLGLPDGNGMALVADVRRRLPDLPVIVASGHSGPPDSAVVWLPKPFDRQGLCRALEDALGMAGAP